MTTNHSRKSEKNAAVQRTPALPSNLKSKNRQLVLECFRDNQDHTVSDIVSRTGISKLTVMRAIQFFCSKDILVSAGKGDSTEQGGKKPEFFRFAWKQYLLNITMWPTSLSLTLFSMNMTRVGGYSYEWIIPNTAKETFDYIGQRSSELLAQLGLTFSDLYGVNLSTSGITDYTSLTLKYSVHTPKWGPNVPIGQYLREIYGEGPVILVENAGKCVSRSAVDLEPDKRKRILVLFTAWGLSGALFQDGEILNGRDSLIGEIGHMIQDPSDSEECSCGGRGCVEQLVSEARVRKRIEETPPPADSLLSKVPAREMTLRTLFAAAQQGDAYGKEQVEYLADQFATLIRNVSLVFDPETVIFVGNYALAGSCFHERILESLSRFHYLQSCPQLEILYDIRSLTELDARGGAIALTDRFFADPSIYMD